ncbi:class I SAM-dependent methyltransferase [Alkalibacillus haloalkaliphilus]|uniref:N-methyltransferase n=1 Tax=Alkalibacillus haloalkaliphilus TaxID=94136 RepID=A0A511W501_9BACI|nr:class I SAM-dependent methyltransferase [Alkalibacillus haloalkaliphilus]GEN46184.1 N-methyltransferase [Alkalibacillus haloalkaliphilus]
MESKWVKPFYNRQFEMFAYLHEYSENYLDWAKEIEQQVNQPFQSVLEIGAGNGHLAKAVASLGKDVTTVELVPDLVDFARQDEPLGVTSICASFYDVDLIDSFDVLLYIDGFGVDGDDEQLYLLKRINQWLKPNGVGLIDIYNPNYWKKAAGQSMYIDPSKSVLRKYDYDQENQRMVDTWWEEGAPDDTYTQTLACYKPNEIESLCDQAGLKIVGWFPGGAMDWDEWKYNPKASLEDCLSYRIKVVKS